MKKIMIAISAAALLLAACTAQKPQEAALLSPADFDGEVDGKPVALYTLKGGNVILQVTNFGARVATIFTPDKDGNMVDVVLGRANLNDYVNYPGERFLGACVGPVANRIGNASFEIDGVTYNVPKNDHDVNTLHGGFTGLDMVVWDVVACDDNSITLHYCHKDMEEGYPGNLDITMKYTVTENSEFKIDYLATTDKKTHCNISNHPFFNLSGEGVGDILDYDMYINADAIVPIDALSIPTGEIMPVEGTPFDFREIHKIGERINTEGDEQLKNAKGYDHNWCLNKAAEGLTYACSVYNPANGIFLEVLTDQPGIQFYSGNFFDGSGSGKYGTPLNFRASLALETQCYPDTPNQPSFPSTILEPGQEYHHTCVYRFSVK